MNFCNLLIKADRLEETRANSLTKLSLFYWGKCSSQIWVQYSIWYLILNNQKLVLKIIWINSWKLSQTWKKCNTNLCCFSKLISIHLLYFSVLTTYLLIFFISVPCCLFWNKMSFYFREAFSFFPWILRLIVGSQWCILIKNFN